MMGMESPNLKRRSIIHVQNAFISNPINLYVARETSRYIIAYELKNYRVHSLLYKIEKSLINNLGKAKVDINVREDYRWRFHVTDQEISNTMKNITVRIIPTRYEQYNTIYATFITTKWRKTGKGGTDEFMPNINECPMIANYNTVYSICYKEIGSQTSGGGTHGTKTYIVLSRSTGEHVIGKYAIVSNSGKTYLELPVRVML